MKRVAFVTTIVFATVALLFLFWQLQSVVFTFIFSLALAAAMAGPVNFLVQQGWARGWAVVSSFLALLLGLILFLLLVALPLINEIDPLVRNLIVEYHRIQETWLRLTGSQPTLATRLPSTAQLAAWWAGGESGGLLRTLVGATQSLSTVLGQFLLALVISIYWMLDQLRFERLWLSLLPPEGRMRARDSWRQIEHDVGSYLRSEFLQFVLAMALLTVGYGLLGVKQPVLLALFGAIAWLLPLIGPIFAVPAAALIGWLSGLDVAIAAALYTIGVLASLEYYVEPRLYRHERYWNVLVVLVMLILGDALGLVGLLLAPPLAVAIQIVLNRLLAVEVTPAAAVTPAPAMATLPTPTPPTTVAPDLATLQTRLADLRTQLKPDDAGGSHRANNLYARLEHLLGEVAAVIAPAPHPERTQPPERTVQHPLGLAENR